MGSSSHKEKPPNENFTGGKDGVSICNTPPADGSCYLVPLPTDLYITIGKYLSAEEIGTIALASFEINQTLASDPRFWRQLCIRDFNYTDLNAWDLPKTGYRQLYMILHKNRGLLGLFKELTWPKGGLVKVVIGPKCFKGYDMRIIQPVNPTHNARLSHVQDDDEDKLSEESVELNLHPSEVAEWRSKFQIAVIQNGSDPLDFSLQAALSRPVSRKVEMSVTKEGFYFYGRDVDMTFAHLEIMSPGKKGDDSNLLNGLYFAYYGPHGWEILHGEVEQSAACAHLCEGPEHRDTFFLAKITGDVNVPRGEVTHRAVLVTPQLKPDQDNWRLKRYRAEGQVAGHAHSFPMFIKGCLDLYKSGSVYISWVQLDSRMRLFRLNLDDFPLPQEI